MEIHLTNGQILIISDDAQIFEDELSISSITVHKSKLDNWFMSRRSIEIFDHEDTYVINTANIVYIKM